MTSLENSANDDLEKKKKRRRRLLPLLLLLLLLLLGGGGVLAGCRYREHLYIYSRNVQGISFLTFKEVV